MPQLSGALLGGLLALAHGCAEGGSLEGGGQEGGGGCTPGAAIACGCPDGGQGAQACAADGSSYLPCECSGLGTDTNEGGSEDGPADTEEASAGLDSTSTGGGLGECGDAIEDPGECDPADPAFCPADCGEAMDTTDGDPCAGAPTFFAAIPGVGSRWEHMGFVGFAAGNAMCVGLGADHVCDYEEIVLADSKGELAGQPVGSAGWVHRTTAANSSAGVPTMPGLGGRCVDWTYTTNHLSDGEYVVFTAAGPEFHLDEDTFYDGASTDHAQLDLLQCGNEARSVLCCHAACR